MAPKQYYVVVELHDYDGKKIAESSCSCGDDLSDESIIASSRVAGALMVEHHTGIKIERKEQGK